MAIESKNLLVAIKAFSRGESLPLDASEVHESMSAAQTYAASPTAYAGQTIKVLNAEGKHDTYVLNGEVGALTLDKVGIDASAVKNYVQVVDTLPTSGQEQGVIYIVPTENKGYIYNGTEYQVIFQEYEILTPEVVEKVVETVETIEKVIEFKLNEAGEPEGVEFTGTVALPADPTQDLEAATKQYVDRLVEGLNSFTVGVVDSKNPLPTEGYEVGQTFRVAEAGTYLGQQAEPGDLILVTKDYEAGTASDADFTILQSNIDGGVTGPAASTDANIVIFDGITGKKIKDSNVTLAALQDTIAKAHTHGNKEILDSFTKTETEILTEVDSKIDSKLEEVDVAGQISTALGNYYTKTEIDNKLTPIQENLNTKIDAAYVSERIGDIGESTTVKEYVDTAVGSGGADVAQQILEAKNEAINTSKQYTDQALMITEF